MSDDLKPQAWILFKRPDELPADALPGDWPGPYVARRFERNDKAEMQPTEDVLHAESAAHLRKDIVFKYSPNLWLFTRKDRTPEDHETIVETVFIRPKMKSPDIVVLQNRLPGGMKVDEAVVHAEAWWDNTGRHVLRKQFNQRDDGTDVIPSGILKCLPWAMLTRKEQVQVVLKWHDAKLEKQ